MAKDRDADNPSTNSQSKRPNYSRHDTSDSQVSSDHAALHNSRQKPQKHHHVGGATRLHARVPSNKGLHKSHHAQSATRLNRRQPSPSPERPSMQRRHTSDPRLTAAAASAATSAHGDSSSSNLALHLKKNSSHSNLAGKRNRSHVEITKRPKSTTNIKRSSSHKDVHKLKGAKGQVHFDLGNEGQEDEWVDASASASPYLSRRGSIVSSAQSSAKDPAAESSPRPHTPPARESPVHDQPGKEPSPNRETAQHNNYITSRLLQRTPSHGAPPQMSSEVAFVPPRTGSPSSQTSRGPPSLYGTPKTGTIAGSGGEELTSRFVHGSGPGSGPNGEAGSYFMPANTHGRRAEGMKRPQSLGDLNREHRDSISGDEDDESALAPQKSQGRRSLYKGVPAGQSRTQQKLNLERASSTMEPTQAVGGVGATGAGPLVGGTEYAHRDPRVGKMLERTGMEYLVVRRYQNPIARSMARLSNLPGANKNQRIPRPNGINGMTHRKKPSEMAGDGRLGVSHSSVDVRRSRPTTPRRSTSIRVNGANSSFEGEEGRIAERMSGASLVEGEDDSVAAILRNLWDKNLELSASQD